jgi:ribosomal protein S7
MIIKWYKEEKIRWHMGGVGTLGKFFIRKLIEKIYRDGKQHTAASILGQVKSHQRIDSKGRKILFVEEIK